MVKGAAVNIYLMEAHIALNLRPIATDFIDINKLMTGVPVYWFPKERAQQAVIEFHKEADGGMATAGSRGDQINSTIHSALQLIGCNNNQVGKRRKAEKRASEN
jgi:prenyltransferase beta subunit